MEAIDFLTIPQSTAQKQYEALRAFYIDGRSAAEVAEQFGYTLSSFYALNRDFKQRLNTSQISEQFFVSPSAGRKPKDTTGQVESLIIKLRKQYLSVPEIKTHLDALELDVSESTIYLVLKQAGFARLPRRSRTTSHQRLSGMELSAPTSKPLSYIREKFSRCWLITSIACWH